MAIPDYQTIMLPLLKFAGDQKEHSGREAIDHIGVHFGLTEDEKKSILPSGHQYIVDNRVGWARTYLKKAGLLEHTRRSHFRITEKGSEVLSQKPLVINVKFLEQFPQFNEFQKREKIEKGDEKELVIQEETSQTPQELIENGYQRLRGDLAQELIDLVKQSTPRFFEHLVVDLLLKMGYGGSLKGAGKAIGKGGDGGIDAIIKQDKLGLDVIYVQAKRWENNVGSGEVRDFVGSLVGKNAIKGVFITTSGFTKDALEYVRTLAPKVILIDGDSLAQFMMDHNVGVSVVTSYEVKKIDSDYFSED